MKKKAKQFIKPSINIRRIKQEEDFPRFQNIEHNTSPRGYAVAWVRCNGCGKFVEGVYCIDGMCEECHINKKQHRENSNVITKNDILSKKHGHVEGYYTCNNCGKKLNTEEAKAWENNGVVYTFCAKCYQQKEDAMFEKAKVVTSKFLVLKDKLNNDIKNNGGAFGAEYGCNILYLQKAFGELCELLHELVS